MGFCKHILQANKELLDYWCSFQTNTLEDSPSIERYAWAQNITQCREIKQFNNLWTFLAPGYDSGKRMLIPMEGRVPIGFLESKHVVDDLSIFLPKSPSIDRILPVLVSSYFFRTTHNYYESGTSSLEEKKDRFMCSIKRELKPYLRRFAPLEWYSNGLKPKSIDKLVTSRHLFTCYLYLVTFVKALLEYTNAGICDLRTSLDVFEQETKLLGIFYSQPGFDSLRGKSDEEILKRLWFDFLWYNDKHGTTTARLYYRAYWMAEQMLARSGLSYTAFLEYTEKSSYYRCFRDVMLYGHERGILVSVIGEPGSEKCM